MQWGKNELVYFLTLPKRILSYKKYPIEKRKRVTLVWMTRHIKKLYVYSLFHYGFEYFSTAKFYDYNAIGFDYIFTGYSVNSVRFLEV